MNTLVIPPRVLLAQWDGRGELVIPADGRHLYRLQTTVRYAIERDGGGLVARADKERDAVVVTAE